jgi:adenylate cyclase
MASEPEPAAPEALQRKLTTILSADVAGYSRLMADDEEATLGTFRGHRQVFESLVALHHGRIFNTAGDAILAEFASAVEAVRCAAEIQAALRTRNDYLAEERRIEFRIGVNLGNVMVQGSDLLGDGVNVAARLQAAAEPGGICISGSVYDQIRNKLSLAFRAMGEQSFKNIPQPVRTFSIVGAEGAALPAPKSRRRQAARPLAAAAAAVLVIGAGYWAFREFRAPVARHPAAQLSAPGAHPAETLALASTDAGSAGGAAEYAGPICYGPGGNDEARCFRAHATVAGGAIASRWPGRDPGITVVLSGEVSPSGEARIEIHGENADGRRTFTINLTGRLHDDRLDATGSFLGGRTASLNWRRVGG